MTSGLSEEVWKLIWNKKKKLREQKSKKRNGKIKLERIIIEFCFFDLENKSRVDGNFELHGGSQRKKAF